MAHQGWSRALSALSLALPHPELVARSAVIGQWGPMLINTTPTTGVLLPVSGGSECPAAVFEAPGAGGAISGEEGVEAGADDVEGAGAGAGVGGRAGDGSGDFR